MYTSVASILLGVVLADSHDKKQNANAWDFTTNGQDWPLLTGMDLFNCNGTQQSPIDLSVGNAQKFNSEDDYHGKIYTDAQSVESEWNGFARTEKIPDYITNTYNSKFNNDKYFAPHQWKAEKIYWRSDSEHTIDGKRFPVEMQMEHRSSEFDSRQSSTREIKKSMISVLFDTDPLLALQFSKREIDIIDALFQNVRFGSGQQKETLPTFAIGRFMSNLNTQTRYVYHGSMTFPPCKANIQWNVVSQVYPVKQKYVDMMKKEMDVLQTEYNMSTNGNYRMTQLTTDAHNLYYISPPTSPLMLITGAIALVLVLYCIFTCICYKRLTTVPVDKTGQSILNEMDDMERDKDYELPKGEVELKNGEKKENPDFDNIQQLDKDEEKRV